MTEDGFKRTLESLAKVLGVRVAFEPDGILPDVECPIVVVECWRGNSLLDSSPYYPFKGPKGDHELTEDELVAFTYWLVRTANT